MLEARTAFHTSDALLPSHMREWAPFLTTSIKHRSMVVQHLALCELWWLIHFTTYAHCSSLLPRVSYVAINVRHLCGYMISANAGRTWTVYQRLADHIMHSPTGTRDIARVPQYG
jgi:hypothetical protein